METKVCTKCGEEKSFDDFGKDSGTRDGLKCHCKECRRKSSKLYTIKNKDKILERSRNYKKNNQSKIKAYNKKYSLENKEAIKKRSKDWYNKNKDKASESSRKYYSENKEKRKEYYRNNIDIINDTKRKYNNKNRDIIRERQRKYVEKNKEHLLIKRREWERSKAKNDPQYKIRKSLASRVRKSLFNKNINKTLNTIELLGCSISDFKIHIEKQFQKGMSWDNYGVHGWHIDHRVPCASFDLTKESEQKACFHFTNLQPMWAKDNLSKSNKLLYLI